MAINAHQVDIKTIRFLLKKGVDVNARTPCGWTALAHAVIRGFVDITEYLLDNGADMNATDSCGMTPFAHAVIAAKMPMVELFWRRGMDVNWVGSDGKSLVAMAASRYHYYTTLFLLEHGARDYTEDVLLDTAKAHISKQRQILTEYILTRVRTF
ncbi:uncharacterized protein MONBRDRAFT_15743 [Monosiga brevicollis MX1]|uniref:Ankyrin repeat protein n=1 Tax=Monosiga brevicollis TaxID=81824 RepID=A9UUW1_MONBE|nr:uncharacterized protein MONBRDRAFT_15743 [Monosiga brevicollis MX1]EDQ90977.1 predicted protein [Monosiga brevicollis MX1]|eukprot:XP_001744274.1 hypothetical protein [Monosiga brevicollis MX1]